MFRPEDTCDPAPSNHPRSGSVSTSIRRSLALVLLVALVSGPGCAHFPENSPLEYWESHRPVLAMGTKGRSDEMVVMLAFSGGGTRAAALAYGVLEELRDTWIEVDGRPRRLIDEIDLISAVSGGSFTAAYFGLFGDRIFDDFEQRFLRKNFQGALIRRLFHPRNVYRLASSRFGRSDLAAEYYDHELFEGKSIQDFGDTPGPAIVINATDLTRGVRFSFIREKFDPLCNDLVDYKVARAVAASSAVPGLLSPILVRNHHGRCGYKMPPWVSEALKSSEFGSRRYIEARVVQSYVSPEAQPFVYLSDGGITDNLGVRTAFEAVIAQGSLKEILEQAGLGNARNMLMIVVNAQNEPELNLEDVGFFQSLSLMMGVASGIQIRRFNFETMDLLRTSFQGWAKQIDRPGHPFHFHLVEVGFAGVRNDEVRTALNNLPTSFKLDADDVELLKATGRNVLARSSGFAAALDDIGRWHGELAADPAVSDDGSVDGSGELEDAAADP